MLKKLSISNYAIIEQIEVDFSSGFNVITGETGAGKSIMVEALGMVLGERADSNVLNDKSKKCIIELSVEISNYKLEPFFQDNDIDFSNETIIRREINIEGKSRAFINDTPVNLQLLREFSKNIVDVHSQHQNQLLANSNYRLNALDLFANNAAILNDVKHAYEEYFKENRALVELKSRDLELRKSFDYNQYMFNELLEAALENDMQERLENEQKILANANSIKSIVAYSLNYLSADDQGVIAKLVALKTQLGQLEKLDNTTTEFSNRIKSSIVDLKDFNDELEAYVANINDDAQALIRIEDSLNIVYKLLKKHNVANVQGLIDLRNKLEGELNLAQNFDNELKKATEKLEQKKTDYFQLASVLSENRINEAVKLTIKVSEILSLLGMPNSSLNFEVLDNGSILPIGTNLVNLLFSPNKGLEMQDATRTASGGENSRLMLAIKAVLSEKNKLPTLILDEIDTGVSGEIAAKTASVMKQSAKSMQVIAITHLPQVAAKASHHLYIYKMEKSGKDVTKIRVLNSEDRVEAIASMLSDGIITQAAIENAKMLIAG